MFTIRNPAHWRYVNIRNLNSQLLNFFNFLKDKLVFVKRVDNLERETNNLISKD